MPAASSTTADSSHPPLGHEGEAPLLNGKQLLIDLAAIDLTRRALSRADLERFNPHRGDMALLDWIVWHSLDYRQGVALKQVRGDEFWVAGHFPGRPVFPGVLQVEAAAQLAVYLYNARRADPLTAAFTRIENCSFRNMVVPGDDLYLLCRELRWSRRGFTCAVQGLVGGRITFEATMQGIAV